MLLVLAQFFQQPGVHQVQVDQLEVFALADAFDLMHQQAGFAAGHGLHAGVRATLGDDLPHAVPAVVERLHSPYAGSDSAGQDAAFRGGNDFFDLGLELRNLFPPPQLAIADPDLGRNLSVRKLVGG